MYPCVIPPFCYYNTHFILEFKNPNLWEKNIEILIKMIYNRLYKEKILLKLNLIIRFLNIENSIVVSDTKPIQGARFPRCDH